MEKKLEKIKINNGILTNRIHPCSVCGEVPVITLKRWKDTKLKGKQVNLFFECETEGCSNYNKLHRTGQMEEREFFEDMLINTEILVSEWNSQMEKQNSYINTHLAEAEKVLESGEGIPCPLDPVVKYIKFHDEEGKYSG